MRNAGLPIEVLIEYVGLFQQGDATSEVRKELLIEQRKQLIARMKDMSTLRPVYPWCTGGRSPDGFRGFTICLNGAKEKGVVYGVGAWRKGDIIGTPSMNQAYVMGKNV